MNKAKSLEALKGEKGSDIPQPEPPPNQPQPPEDNKDWHVELIASGSGPVNMKEGVQTKNTHRHPSRNRIPNPNQNPNMK